MCVHHEVCWCSARVVGILWVINARRLGILPYISRLTLVDLREPSGLTLKKLGVKCWTWGTSRQYWCLWPLRFLICASNASREHRWTSWHPVWAHHVAQQGARSAVLCVCFEQDNRQVHCSRGGEPSFMDHVWHLVFPKLIFCFCNLNLAQDGSSIGSLGHRCCSNASSHSRSRLPPPSRWAGEIIFPAD